MRPRKRRLDRGVKTKALNMFRYSNTPTIDHKMVDVSTMVERGSRGLLGVDVLIVGEMAGEEISYPRDRSRLEYN